MAGILDSHARAIAVSLLLIASVLATSSSRAQNVTWSFRDSVASCPAGDSVVAGHPSRLQINVTYLNGSGQPRNGVPPESIYVYALVWYTNLVAHGERELLDFQYRLNADDSTRAGQTRITIPSFSGGNGGGGNPAERIGRQRS